MQISRKIGRFHLILLLLFLGSGNLLFGQNNPEYEELQGGLIGGVNFSQVDGDGYKGYHAIGPTGGGILYLPFGNDVGLPFDGTIALSMEVLYEKKGAKGNGAVVNSGGLTGQHINLNYGEVPIQINLFRGTRKTGFGMGFAISYLGMSEETIELNNGSQIIKNGKPFHKFDLSYVLTVNIHLYNGLFLSPRFEYSLISIRNNNGLYGGRNQQFNNTLSLRLMYLISRHR